MKPGRDPRHQHVEHSARTVARRAATAGALPRHPLLQSRAAHAACRGRAATTRWRHDVVGAGTRIPRPHRPPAGAGQERAGLPGQSRADALHARSHGDARTRAPRKKTIDQAAEDFGMPMGPIELADEVGLDICLHVAEMLQGEHCRARCPTPAMAARQGRQGRARQEDRQGHLRLEGRQGRQGTQKSPHSPAGRMTDRLILPMLDVVRGLPARGRRGGRGHRRWRDDLRHRLCAVPRRADAIRQGTRHRRRCATTLERLAQHMAIASGPIRAGPYLK